MHQQRIGTRHPQARSGKRDYRVSPRGTGFNFTITPERQREYWFKTYIASAQKFREAAQKAGADGMVANHTNLDGSKRKFPLIATRHAYQFMKGAGCRPRP